MTGENLTFIGAMLTLVTLFAGRVLHEQNLRLWTEREKTDWVEHFSVFRISGTCLPVTILLLGMAYGYILPGTRGWTIVIAAIAILLFVLLSQYFQLRRFAYFRFSAVFIRRASWTAAITVVGLIAGISLIAFGMASSIL